MNPDKKPLFRKIDKTTHNGHPHLDFRGKERYKYERHTKKAKFEEENEINFSSGRKHYCTGEDIYKYDYRPLMKFLQKSVGKKWDDVWKECTDRLITTEPVHWIVLNIRKNGLPIECNPTELNPQTRYSEDSYYSTLYVDNDGILQFVDKDYIKEHADYPNTEWGETFNGKVWDNKTKSYRKINAK